MIRTLRENVLLKLIALATAVMIWAYAGTERVAMPTRQVLAEVQPVGKPPAGLDVDVRPDLVTVEVAGPKAQIDAIAEGSVKAIVDLSTVRPDSKNIRVTRFVAPPNAPNAVFADQVKLVVVTVRTAVRKRMQVTARFRAAPPLGKRFGEPRVNPGWADVEGVHDVVERVVLLVVDLSPVDRPVKGDFLIEAVDRDGLTVDGIRVVPPTAHAELDLLDLSVSRSLPISVTLRGRVPPPFVLTGIVCDPQHVTVTGEPQDLMGLANVTTEPLILDGIRSETSRQLALVVPKKVTPADGRTSVTVTVRVKDASRDSP